MGFGDDLLFFHVASTGAILVALAFGLDLMLGDPRPLPHPVVLMGRLINVLEQALRRVARGAAGELAAGALLALILVFFVYMLAIQVVLFFYGLNIYAGHLVTIVLLYTSFSLKSLQEHILAVEEPLLQGDLPAARSALSYLVGRDTAELGVAEISRGALESLSENSSDGVIAPLFYAFLGGAPLALAYKAISTMDSMLGYRNASYLYFGRVAAKLDDLANYIPARLTALLLLAAALFSGRLAPGRFRECLQTTWKESKNHPSPNSGYPEGAAAVLLGVWLGGTSTYQGVVSEKPLINAGGGEATPQHLKELRSLVQQASLLALLLGVLISVAVSWLV